MMTVAVVAPLMMFSSCVDEQRSCMIKATDASIAAIRMACELYRVDTGAYPSSNVWPGCLHTNVGVTGWNGPYVRGDLKDAWGHDFRYSLEGTNLAVLSAGPDGQFGTADDKYGRRKQPRTSGCGAMR